MNQWAPAKTWSSRGLSFKGFQAAKADELAPLLIPETERERFEARKQAHRLHGLKQRIGPMAFLEVVIGDARTEMMDVMKANVAGKPLQHAGKFVQRTAPKSKKWFQ